MLRRFSQLIFRFKVVFTSTIIFKTECIVRVQSIMQNHIFNLNLGFFFLVIPSHPSVISLVIENCTFVFLLGHYVFYHVFPQVISSRASMFPQTFLLIHIFSSIISYHSIFLYVFNKNKIYMTHM